MRHRFPPYFILVIIIALRTRVDVIQKWMARGRGKEEGKYRLEKKYGDGIDRAVRWTVIIWRLNIEGGKNIGRYGWYALTYREFSIISLRYSPILIITITCFMRQSVVEQRKDYSAIIPVIIHLNFNYFVSMYKFNFLIHYVCLCVF